MGAVYFTIYLRFPDGVRFTQLANLRAMNQCLRGLVIFLVGLGLSSSFGHPSAGIVVDQQGNVFISDLTRGILKIDPSGKVSTISEEKEGGHWLALDPEGQFSKVDFTKSSHWPRWFKRRTEEGARPALISDGGSPLVVARDGNLYYVCNEDKTKIPGGLQIARLTPDGKETLLNPALRPLADRLLGIKGLAEGADGAFYMTCPQALLKVSAKGEISTILNPVIAPECDRHPPGLTDSPSLRGIAVNSRGEIFAAATGCRVVLKITPDAKVTTVLKSEAPWSPSGVALRGDDLYILEYINPNSDQHEDWPPRVRKLTRDGIVSTLLNLAPGQP
jgi:sugar lactone lactonase YvrE